MAVIPSVWQEPAGLAAVEAIAAGTPIVAYESGGLAEYVGGAGLVIAPGRLGLADACRRLHEDEDAWRRCSAHAEDRKRILGDEQNFFDRLEAIYEDATRG